jgi:hypothetical protein
MKIDMSPHAITMRLKQSSELRKVCIALGGKRLKRLLKDKSTIKGGNSNGTISSNHP